MGQKKKYLVCGALVGLVISLVLLFIPEIEGEGNGTLRNIYFFCLQFFWPSSPMLMIFHSNELTLGSFLSLSFIVGLNSLFYSVFGWLVWLGVNKSKIFFCLPPVLLALPFLLI